MSVSLSLYHSLPTSYFDKFATPYRTQTPYRQTHTLNFCLYLSIVHIDTQAHPYTQSYAHPNTPIHTVIHTHNRTQIHKHMNTHPCTHIHTVIHTHVQKAQTQSGSILRKEPLA